MATVLIVKQTIVVNNKCCVNCGAGICSRWMDILVMCVNAGYLDLSGAGEHLLQTAEHLLDQIVRGVPYVLLQSQHNLNGRTMHISKSNTCIFIYRHIIKMSKRPSTESRGTPQGKLCAVP